MQLTIERAFTEAHRDKAIALAHIFGDYLQRGDDAIFTYDREPEAIETEARSGFIPWTSGGAELVHCASIGYARGSGCASAPIQAIIESDEAFMEEEWARNFPDRPSIWDCIHGYDDPAIPREWQSEAEDWDNEWFMSNDDCYYYKARVIFLSPDDRQNESGAPEVYIDCYLVTDSYGRDDIPWLSYYGQNRDQTRGDFKRTMPLEEFAAMDLEAMQSLVTEALAMLP